MYNNFGEGLEKVKTICINLRRRRDRKIKMKKLLKKEELNFHFLLDFIILKMVVLVQENHI